ncbi:hypothetical protein E4T50_01167 [Aureobasidium sp. EXF-12298]|nr:hypothetical protein E4T50_01167 [Aureobasidium sp. EXF-12298]KAI4766261.1 hypothetical protein E4T51_00824 [Aureobasidium sp. EXF-12344]KAI4783735.1 hypothetical protein E4T52_01358 [Aureobasidium sp. EXF-3400]
MDINSTGSGDFYPGGIPKGAANWERYILDQQATFGGSNHAPLSRRRKTVVGIPSFGEFLREYEDRANEQRRRTNPRKDSHQTADEDKDDFSHNNMHFGADFLPASFSSTASSIHTKHSSPHVPMSKKLFTPGSRHSRHASASRPKLPESFMSAPDVPRPESPETFKRKIHEHKTKFNVSQKQRSHSRLRHMSLLSSRLYEHPPGPNHIPPSQPTAKSNGPSPVTMYALWRQDCDEQLKDKSTMTHVPVLPLPTCSECANASILGGQPVPITCGHSLDKVFRTGIDERPGSFAFSKAYFAILKVERQRWHTDRFGACNPDVKFHIVADAQQLFILINDLFEIEKLRMVEMAEMIPEHVPAHQPCHTPDYFKFRPDERPAW